MVRPHRLATLLGTSLALSAAIFTGTFTSTARADESPWRYVQSYHSKPGCQEAGEAGRRAGQWTEAKCVKTPYRLVDPYNLWVR